MDREALRKKLAQCAGENPDSCTLAEAALNTLQQMAAQLVPVIGALSVDTLFSRALQVTGQTFPWLAIDLDGDDVDVLLAGLKGRLAHGDTADAAECAYLLLVNFSELLATLIGESLTNRLLGAAWTPLSANSVKVNQS